MLGGARICPGKDEAAAALSERLQVGPPRVYPEAAVLPRSVSLCTHCSESHRCLYNPVSGMTHIQPPDAIAIPQAVLSPSLQRSVAHEQLLHQELTPPLLAQAAAEPKVVNAAERLRPGTAVDVATAVVRWEKDSVASLTQRRATLQNLVQPLTLLALAAARAFVSFDGATTAVPGRAQTATAMAERRRAAAAGAAQLLSDLMDPQLTAQLAPALDAAALVEAGAALLLATTARLSALAALAPRLPANFAEHHVLMQSVADLIPPLHFCTLALGGLLGSLAAQKPPAAAPGLLPLPQRLARYLHRGLLRVIAALPLFGDLSSTLAAAGPMISGILAALPPAAAEELAGRAAASIHFLAEGGLLHKEVGLAFAPRATALCSVLAAATAATTAVTGALLTVAVVGEAVRVLTTCVDILHSSSEEVGLSPRQSAGRYSGGGAGICVH